MEATEALSWGLVTEVVPHRHTLERSLEIAEGLARFPQETMLADRAAALASFGHPLEAGLAIEASAGLPTLQVALAGAARFAGGEGRGGAGSGV
jgi:enoyl-CoA hydratase